MKKILELPITNENTQIFELPKGAEIICIKKMNADPTLIAIADMAEKETENREIILLSSGADIPEDAKTKFKYLGTTLFYHDTKAIHFFEKIAQ